LEAKTAYQVRLTATKSFGGGSTSASTSFKSLASVPLMQAPVLKEATDSSADLTARINPENEATSYAFQCLTEARYSETRSFGGAAEYPAGGGLIPPAGEAIVVGQTIEGLLAMTEYRCRLVAANGTGQGRSESGAVLEVVFGTYNSTAPQLPDGRAYEQVTPVDKNGSDANGFKLLTRASPDGDAASYFINGGSSGGEGGQDFPTYVDVRSEGAWGNYGLLPSEAAGEFAQVVGWSEDLRSEYVIAYASRSSVTLYRRDNLTGSLEVIATGFPFGGNEQLYAGESAGGESVLFETTAALTPEAPSGITNLYLWNRASGTLSLVDILPEETPAPSGAFAGAYFWPNLESKVGGSTKGFYTQDQHVISSDGSKVFFTTSNVNQLYVRKGLGGPSPVTTEVSESQKSNGTGPGGKDPGGLKKAAFMEATPDGRFVFFTSPSELTNDATTGTADQGNDLYRFDTESGSLIDIAPDATDVHGAEVQGVVGSSDDGSYVYFVANGVLANPTTVGNCNKNPIMGANTGSGVCNLYVWHDGLIEFVAKVAASEPEGLYAWQSTSYNGQSLPMNTSRVAADGQALVFSSALSPAKYQSEGAVELYRYSFRSGLTCVSCNPTGGPSGNATISNLEPGFTSPVPTNPFLLRYTSSDDSRIFFQTVTKLVPADVNGRTGCEPSGSGSFACQDVYEWEADGTGSCQSVSEDGGCLFLISTGQSTDASYLVGASASGDDVFFLTRQSLVSQDTDGMLDIYDARVGGGIASQNEVKPVPCDSEGCRGAAAQSAAPASAGTATFVGPGNPVSKKHHKKKHHKKKHHKKKHHKKKHHKKKQRGTGR